MNIIITGSTAGLGLSMAIKFLQSNDKVIISSRSSDKVNTVCKKLTAKFGSENVFGIPCDVSKASEVKQLAHESVELLGTINIWINNAGTSYKHGIPLIDNSDEMLEQIVDTNLLGTLLGCREALKIMTPQDNGHIVNIAGRGTDGNASKNLIAYAATKRALDVLHKSLVKETDQSNVGIHLISPGMVLTKLLFQENTPLGTRKIFNILAEHPTVVANKLVPKIRNLKGTGSKTTILDRKKALFRFITFFRYKNKFFDKEGKLLVSIDPMDTING